MGLPQVLATAAGRSQWLSGSVDLPVMVAAAGPQGWPVWSTEKSKNSGGGLAGSAAHTVACWNSSISTFLGCPFKPRLRFIPCFRQEQEGEGVAFTAVRALLISFMHSQGGFRNFLLLSYRLWVTTALGWSLWRVGYC